MRQVRSGHLVGAAGCHGQTLIGGRKVFVFFAGKTSATANLALLEHILRAVVTHRVPQDGPVHGHLSGITVRQLYPTARQNLLLYSLSR